MSSIDGLNEVLRNLDMVERKVKESIRNSVRDCSFDLLQRAKDLTPVDTGDLKASGFVEITDNGDVVEVGFNTPYALKQHEDLTYNHPQGGQSKYLEEPFQQNLDKYKEKIIEDIKDALDL